MMGNNTVTLEEPDTSRFTSMMFSTSRMRQFEMVASASLGIMTWNSEWISELGPTMASAVTDARFFTTIVRGPESLETVKKKLLLLQLCLWGNCSR